VSELRNILSLELDAVQRRITSIGVGVDVRLRVLEAARDHLLAEGTDARYGARHLKRAVEKLVVQPVSNLIASGQLQNGDRLIVDYDGKLERLVFYKENSLAVSAGKGSVAA